MNKMFKTLKKNVDGSHLLVLLGVVILGLAMYKYSQKKVDDSETFNGYNSKLSPDSLGSPEVVSNGNPTPSALGEDNFAKVEGIKTTSNGVPTAGSCGATKTNPSDLLPKNAKDSEWALLNPNGKGNLEQVNLLSAGQLAGINTVGTSRRNANQTLRQDPPIEKVNVGPWSQTTITPDQYKNGLSV